jgi:hypothetical protein
MKFTQNMEESLEDSLDELEDRLDDESDDEFYNGVPKYIHDIFEEANMVPYNYDPVDSKTRSEYLKKDQDLAIGPNRDIILVRKYDEIEDD